jgi:hypothetical protein
MDHLPGGQKGILYRSDYLILSNPMPVFSSHFTVSHIDHRLQTIDEHVQTFLQLLADLGQSWTVLYNGPKCGASAPDHFHFQVGPLGQMPIEKELRAEKKLTLIKKLMVFSSIVQEVWDGGYHPEGDDPVAVGRLSEFSERPEKGSHYR